MVGLVVEMARSVPDDTMIREGTVEFPMKRLQRGDTARRRAVQIVDNARRVAHLSDDLAAALVPGVFEIPADQRFVFGSGHMTAP